MKTALTIVCVLGVMLVFVVGATFVLLGGPQSLRYRRQFSHLVETNDHEAIARAAIAVIQSTTNQMLWRGDSLTDLPPQISGMNPQYVSVSPNHMKMEFHGGFDHFGFRIENREGSWEMSWYTEAGRHALLSIGKSDPDVPANRSSPIPWETNPRHRPLTPVADIRLKNKFAPTLLRRKRRPRPEGERGDESRDPLKSRPNQAVD